MRDEVGGVYQGEAASAALSRNMCAWWKQVPIMLFTAFMQCTCDRYSDLFPLLLRGRICYFCLRWEGRDEPAHGKVDHRLGARRTRWKELDSAGGAGGGGALVYGQSPTPSNVGIAGQRWLLEVESKAADRITLFERMHCLLRDWGWEPFATIDVGDELDDDGVHQDSGRAYRFGEGFDGDFEYVSFDDTALASMFRFRVYRWSARGRWLGVRLGSGVLSVVVYWILRILLFIYLVIGLPVALVLTL